MAEPKGYELIQLKLKKTAAALRMSGGQLKEQSDQIRDLINTCEDFLSDETLSPMEALKKPLIAKLIELLAPVVDISTESMSSLINTSVKGAESDENPIVSDALNPFSSLHISLEDATKDFTANGEEIYFINIACK